MGYGIVDCEYSLSIFDDLKATFVDNEEAATEELMEEAGIEENTDELGTEGIVKANWGGKKHIDLVSGSSISIVDDYLNVLLIGARLPDSELCDLYGKKRFPALHGYYEDYEYICKNKKKKRSSNYVAGYLYLSRLARQVKKNKYTVREKGSLGDVFTNLDMEGIIDSKGINSIDEKTGNIVPFQTSKWDNIFKSKLYDGEVAADDTSQSDDEFVKNLTEKKAFYKSLVVYGMSLHTMTDAFAHSSWGYGENVKKWQWGMPGDVTDRYKANDNKNVIRLRYKAARQAVLNSMDNVSISSEGVLTIEPSTTLDFCSRAYKDEDSAAKKGNDEWDYNRYIHKIDGKPVAIEMKYFEKGFGIMNIWTYAKKCDKKSNKYLKRIDKDRIASVSGMFGVVKYDSDVKESVNVSLINEKTEQEIFSTTSSISAGTLNLALNKDLKEGEYYVIKGQASGDSEIKIGSKTLFKAPEKTEGKTIINLMDVWDTGKRMSIILEWNNEEKKIGSHMKITSEDYSYCKETQQYRNSEGILIAQWEDKEGCCNGSGTLTIYDTNISFSYYIYAYFENNKIPLSKSISYVEVHTEDGLAARFGFNCANVWGEVSYNGNSKQLGPVLHLYRIR